MSLKSSVSRGLKLTIKKEKRSTEPTTVPSLVEVIEQVAEAENTHGLGGFFRPSMLFGCDRQNVFYYNRVKESPQAIDARLRRILDNGTAVHEVIQDRYLNMHPDYWFVKEPKVVVEIDGCKVKGSCDGVLIRRSDFFKVGVEIKTITHNEFMKLAKPKDEHVFQASVYAYIQKLEWIVILYWDKDKQLLREYPVQRDPVVWGMIEERVEYLSEFIHSEDRKLPRFDKSTCNKTFCSYVAYCRKKGAPV